MKKKKIIIIIICSIILITVTFFIYVSDYYKAIDSDKYLISDDKVKVIKDDNGYYFDGRGEDNIIIFYPGAKVEYTAYANLLYNLSSNGIDCFLTKMPFNIAFFGKNKGDSVINKYHYDNYYVMGHSLGGVVLSSFIKNRNDISGIIFLASYPNNKINVKMLSIYGDNDKVLNLDRYNKSKKYFSDNYKEFIIKGGNHANYGYYGMQKGDGKSLISREEQINITVNEIIKFINS